MKITICDVCGKLFDEGNYSKCTIGYTDYEICEDCQNKIVESMTTKSNDYIDRVDRELFDLALCIKNKNIKEENNGSTKKDSRV